MLLSFSPHPVEVLNPGMKFERIFPLADMEEQLDLLGLDYLVVEPFSRELASLTPQKFWQDWVQAYLSPSLVFVGHDFRFGAEKTGNFKLLAHLSAEYGFDLRLMPAVKSEGEVISSTRIKELLALGHVRKVRQFLGRNFEMRGVVIEGQRLGRKLGFPTANIENVSSLLPLSGVYFTQTLLENGIWYPSVTNVGKAPTLRGEESRPRVETHLLENLNFSLYNQKLRIALSAFWRTERKFSNMEELRSQISLDVGEARKYWAQQNLVFGRS
ncbi:MAG: riboflavin biosynthesis protein RibF [Bdellovibrionales bacterium]|nr:riboflavin biosynthesis protein RibF [Bdellovibrionales bacterium]